MRIDNVIIEESFRSGYRAYGSALLPFRPRAIWRLRLKARARYFELNGERNITASIAIDLQSMIEDNHVGFTRDELSYMLNNVYDMTVNMKFAVVFYHSPCCIIFRTNFLFY